MPPPPSECVRSLITVTGGAGGVGTSLVALNLSVYLAQLGRRVVLADANPAGAQLHRLMGCKNGLGGGDMEHSLGSLRGQQTSVPGLFLLPQVYEKGSGTPRRRGRRVRWAQQLRGLSADYVVVDLGVGTSNATLDLFLAADLGVSVTTPEPPSIEGLYRFSRAAFQRRLERRLVSDPFKTRLLDRVLAELPPLPAPRAVIRTLARHDVPIARLAARELATLRPYILVNDARLRADFDLGPSLAENATRHLGVSFDHLGTIEQDDAVRTSVLRSRPVLIENPTCKAARSLERIARRITALANKAEAEPEPAPSVDPDERGPTLYELLGIHRGASDEEVRRAYKRQRGIYRPGSLPLVSLLDGAELDAATLHLEEAHDTLLDPLKRRAYDLSTFPDVPGEETTAEVTVDHAAEAERAQRREELEQELEPDTQFTGPLLRRVRDAHGQSLDAVAQATKISKRYLEAIEEEDFVTLPATVYTRGFLQLLARHLRLDQTLVTRTYMARVRRWEAADAG